jgi:hypothetical protein
MSSAPSLPPETPSPTKKCPFCAEIILADAIVCRFCGRDVQKKDAALVRGKPFQFGVILLVLVAISCVLYFANENGPRADSVSENSSKDTGIGPATSPAQLPVSGITWNQLNDTFRTMENMTELQREEKWKEFSGKKVKWTGTVLSVDDSWGLVMKLDMAHLDSDQLVNWNPYESLQGAVDVQLDESDRSRALALNAGSSVTVVGVLDISSSGDEKGPIIDLSQGAIASEPNKSGN